MHKNLALLGAFTATLTLPAIPAAALDAPATVETATQTALTPETLATVDIAKRAGTTLVSPLKAGTYRMTSPQGPRCIPVIGGSTFHEGQDFGVANGSPIYSVTDGVVTKTRNGTNNLSGYIVIRSTIGTKQYDLAYYHMWNANTHVKVGTKVKAGQRISSVGNSGPSTGPHLHMEIWNGPWYGSKTVDPNEFLKARGLNLELGATYINRYQAPAVCNYRINQPAALKASASSTSQTLRNISTNTIVTSKPGTLINNMVPINVAGTSGWVNRYAISPYSGPAPSQPSKPSNPVSTTTKIHSKKIQPGTYTATSNVNLRAHAPSGNVLTTVPKDAHITATGTTGHDGNWYQVKYGKSSGWISGSYLKAFKLDPVATIKPQPVTKKTMVTTGGLNLRDKAVTGKVLTAMPQGSTVTLTGKTAEAGKWVQVKYKSTTGWASKAYLANPGQTTPSKPAPAPKPPAKPSTPAASKTTAKTTASLNLRDKAVTGKVLATMPQGSTVTLTGKTAEAGKWIQVKYKNTTGWASKAYLNTSKPAPKPTPKPVAQSSSKKTTATLNVRAGANPTHKILTTLKQGTKVTVQGKSDKNGWVKIKHADTTGYVNSKYLK